MLDNSWLILLSTILRHSENVATTEVAHVVGQYPGIAEASVYGVLVPHHDGRAGM